MSSLITLLFHDVYRNSPDESGFAGVGAERYKLPLHKFRDQLASVARERNDLPILVRKDPSPAMESTPYVFTVDDGGVSYHAIIAPLLEEYAWRGHCLITTSQLGRRGFLHAHHVRELHQAGHVIGSHSVTHAAHFDTCTRKQLLVEWGRSKAMLEDIIGAPVLTGSIPGGYYSRRVVQAASSAGLAFLFTSEPQTKIYSVDGCQVIGRFAVRRDSASSYAGNLVATNPLARWQQWLAWNAKKGLKKSLGLRYQQLSNWLAQNHGQ